MLWGLEEIMIKELIENPKEAAKAWPNTTWHGRNVHKEVYELIAEKIEPLLKKRGWTFQEVYLAYLDPTNSGDDDNGFIVGYDVWVPEDEANDAEFISCYVIFEINNEPELLNAKDPQGPNGNEELRLRINYPVDIDICYEGGFYPHGRKMLKENWSGLIELRLD
jgi:hypothetical protein